MSDDDKKREKVTIYISGDEEKSAEKSIVAYEIYRAFSSQGINTLLLDQNLGVHTSKEVAEHPKTLHDHFIALMNLAKKRFLVSIKYAAFGEGRIKEILDREACGGDGASKPAILFRVTWGNNPQTDSITTGQQYLVLIGEKWYTGQFEKLNGKWMFGDVDQTAYTGGNRKQLYELGREGSKVGIREIYRIER